MKSDVSLAVTCHLHFGQNDLDLLHATAVTGGWNRYQNKSRHRKLTMEKKIHPLFLQGFKPATFQSQVQHSNHSAITKYKIFIKKMAIKILTQFFFKLLFYVFLLLFSVPQMFGPSCSQVGMTTNAENI